MADILPPAPINEPPKSYAWVEWYKNLREFINNTASNIPWISINKAGANLTDIPTRLHNSLQSIQGGTTNQYYHLTSVQHNDLLTGLLSFTSSTNDLTTTDLTNGKIRFHKNTTTGLLKLYANDGGVIKTITLI